MGPSCIHTFWASDPLLTHPYFAHWSEVSYPGSEQGCHPFSEQCGCCEVIYCQVCSHL